MELDKLNLSLRNRSAWEAFDLGFSITQRYFKTIYLPWGIATLLYSLIVYAIFFNNFLFGVLFFLFTIPFFERICLFTISRSIFQTQPSIRDSLKSLFKPLHFSWYFQQLSRVLILPFLLSKNIRYRSFLLPVTQLENLKDKKASNRKRGLCQSVGASISNFTFIFAAIEFIVFYSSYLMVRELMPEPPIIQESFNLLDYLYQLITAEYNLPKHHLMFFIFCFTIILLRPYYVCAGFALYLMRRVDLEGWDIELQFKNLARRITRLTSIFVISLCFFILPQDLHAGGNPQKQIQEIMNTEEFNQHKIIETYVDKSKPIKERPRESSDGVEASSGGTVSSFAAGFIKYVGIAFLIGILIYIIIQYTSTLNPQLAKQQKPNLEPKPSTIMGMSMKKLDKESSWLDQAHLYLKEGNHRACLSYLYRGSLSKLIHDHHLKLKESFTELDCLDIVQQMEDSNIKTYMDNLTKHWLAMAYAHIPPQTHDLNAMIQSWERVFKQPLNPKGA